MQVDDPRSTFASSASPVSHPDADIEDSSDLSTSLDEEVDAALFRPTYQPALTFQQRQAIRSADRDAIHLQNRAKSPSSAVLVRPPRPLVPSTFAPSAPGIDALDLTVGPALLNHKRSRSSDNAVVRSNRQRVEYLSDDDSEELQHRIEGARDKLKDQFLREVAQHQALTEQVRAQAASESAQKDEELQRLRTALEVSNRKRIRIQRKYVKSEEVAHGYFWEGKALRATAESAVAHLLTELSASKEEKEKNIQQFEAYKTQLRQQYHSQVRRHRLRPMSSS